MGAGLLLYNWGTALMETVRSMPNNGVQVSDCITLGYEWSTFLSWKECGEDLQGCCQVLRAGAKGGDWAGEDYILGAPEDDGRFYSGV